VVYTWDLRMRRCLSQISDHGNVSPSSLTVSEDGRFFATGSESGVVNVYRRGADAGGWAGANTIWAGATTIRVGRRGCWWVGRRPGLLPVALCMPLAAPVALALSISKAWQGLEHKDWMDGLGA